jgi:ribosomal protein S18 acetylase RimI-like enzyme
MFFSRNLKNLRELAVITPMKDATFLPLSPGRSDVPRLAQMLASAFWDYPVYQAMIPDERLRKRLPVLFEVLTTYAMRYGAVLVPSEDLEGVLMALPWERGGISAGRMLLCGAARIPGALGLGFLRREAVINRVQEKMHATLAPRMHTYLWNLAVDPAHQGKGIGAGLVRALLSDLSEQHRPCYLETAKPGNVKIYTHLGFRIVGTYEFPEFGFTTTGMLWEG